ncbi:response regulator transcription factor [Clostridium beijerinckii]|uniref:Stage 0 sporulation protein A homolog n=1 Tax=Clostridium beijerinckii TaxID=1520 RepID=A0A1S9N2U6_CLOBE|nr:response regulator transcription factor [Clostridium beijerinckii]MBN7575774.1 response regulator transcription factor [Clostridium beijerinckii]MBN7581196.1 response regulator transcription factor [Clostridium beijerinckii]MBN7585783.1 response regulator transcription factor [Clostridium beijerinckii]MBO0521395.1 response regulator transcription factor [Clostridium beijerinckii]MZK49247.1 response regulator [Clostridium beijerinckii]
MYGVLIVDDESIIREGLIEIICWEEYGMKIIGQASNGEEALKIIKSHNPKIVITDIRMPFMNGIELIKAIKLNSMNIRTIVLSGYDDFLYVREAMKYGAENYILKPVDKDELNNTIKEILERIENEMFSESQKKESTVLLRNNTLNRIISNEITLKEFREKQELLEINLYCSQMCIAVIECNFYEISEAVDEENSVHLKRFKALNICEEIIERYIHGIVFEDKIGNITVIFRNTDAEITFAEVNEILNKCINGIEKHLKISSVAAVGAMISSHRDLHRSYKEAIESLNYKFIFGYNKVLFFDSIRGYKKKNTDILMINFDLISNHIKLCKEDEVKSYISQIYDCIIEGKQNIEQDLIINGSLELLICIFNAAKEFNINAKDLLSFKNHAFSEIENVRDINALKEKLLESVAEIFNIIRQLKNKKFSKVVSNSIKHIEKKYYSQEISLKTLSNSMNINSAYLGRIFKTETGEFFTDYLNKVRIDKAKELLLNTNLKASDISVKVGFVNNNYFYTIFKKYTGINPGDFRKV